MLKNSSIKNAKLYKTIFCLINKIFKPVEIFLLNSFGYNYVKNLYKNFNLPFSAFVSSTKSIKFEDIFINN